MNRLRLSLYRAALIEDRHQRSWDSDEHAFNNHPGAQRLMQQALDEIGWGKAVLGITVEEYLKNNPVVLK